MSNKGLIENTFDARQASLLAKQVIDEEERLFKEKINSVNVDNIWDKIIYPQIKKAAETGQTHTIAIIENSFDGRAVSPHESMTEEEVLILKRLAALIKSKGFNVRTFNYKTWKAAYSIQISWGYPTIDWRKMPAYLMLTMIVGFTIALLTLTF